MKIGVVGAGAFGTALAVSLAANGPVWLWGRAGMEAVATSRTTPRLPGITLPEAVHITGDINGLAGCDVLLLAMPMQALADTLPTLSGLRARYAVACCKGIDRTRLTGPAEIIASAWPHVTPAVLSGPSFAADIARGLPTALSLGCADEAAGSKLQDALSTPTLRLYRTTDVTGVELGGALKNVIAIACGCAMGAGLGESARAALMTRGFAEMQRFAAHVGAQPETLQGLSGFGDLALTCTSAQSRNYTYGLALGAGTTPAHATVEGRATAQALHTRAAAEGLDLPITAVTAAIVTGQITVKDAMSRLLSRRLKEE
ncbi:NAD(P)H-dependent glycerol-3-phosphate dehydrogenase [Thalassobacter stenotrophicus]|uniref:Glycerol-3-phosphate dehydrogenase [NAD(P)+] n=2 Tax=Thalassobacter stenotrophicus TaxID=266809 RepID=A0A0P1EX83_9RHOB|nr:NAD(P)H-dependent glycerol-3-phosphate dehydrogenase [Thalassobacter stenotrophicus]PVZ49876.1 NAD(P)-dependent glycerol-3-phosphate dehydrogenase [Thalassobacter stenotrophicus]CUH59670.1 Glycerol-3-phosphate dehydrogenase [NAD(P)+] [Thalassobacter stenotrophicus]SHI91671.1 glycerol-3-phosphate dehydrogenase (NAD(P)+) [Thalassobacter stenotrophicus DSM 16310]